MLSRSRVINPDFLAGSQWGRHSFASRVNNVRSRAESETYRALLAPDDNRLARLICSYRARLVSCARSRFVVVDGLVDVVVSSVVVVLVCANANGATSPQTKAIIVFFILSSFLIKLPPQFVTQRLERTLLVRFISSPA